MHELSALVLPYPESSENEKVVPVVIDVRPIQVEDYTLVAIEVKLPRTTLLAIRTETGYVMCGALDVGLLRNQLRDRGIVAARAVGVKTIEQLLDGTVESCTQAAESIGIQPGMPIREALVRMKCAEQPAPHHLPS